jgi:fructose-1-phosphate kinase PfkB-like protein
MEWRALVQMLAQLSDNADFLVLSGSLPPGLASHTYARLMRYLRKANPKLRLAVDADGPPLSAVLNECPFLIKPNLSEFGRLINKRLTLKTPDTVIIEEATKLCRQGKSRQILVSMGARGCILVASDGVYKGQAPVFNKISTTVGAGDSLLAGYLAGLDQKQSSERSLQVGLGCAAATVAAEGTKLGSKNDIIKYIKKSIIKKIYVN